MQALLAIRKQPRLTVCEDFESVAPGECAICLNPLSDLDPDLAKKPGSGVCLSGKGLLRLPCKHTYHSACAEAWFARNDACPLCRTNSGELRRCTRIFIKSTSTPERVWPMRVQHGTPTSPMSPALRDPSSPTLFTLRAAPRGDSGDTGSTEDSTWIQLEL
jgi:hypothetical protein